MKLSITEDYLLVAEEVFNPLCLRTEDGFDLAVCMRDDGYEIATGKADGKSKDVKRYRITLEGIEEL